MAARVRVTTELYIGRGQAGARGGAARMGTCPPLARACTRARDSRLTVPQCVLPSANPANQCPFGCAPAACRGNSAYGRSPPSDTLVNIGTYSTHTSPAAFSIAVTPQRLRLPPLLAPPLAPLLMCRCEDRCGQVRYAASPTCSAAATAMLTGERMRTYLAFFPPLPPPPTRVKVYSTCVRSDPLKSGVSSAPAKDHSPSWPLKPWRSSAVVALVSTAATKAERGRRPG